MLHVLFTLDYEIHGNGQGSPQALVVSPTERMLRQFDRHGAKLTIMADVGEILRFRRHAEETGRDDFAYRAIEEQLQLAVRTGHDVQFHIHPSFLNATLVDGAWRQDFSEYDVARLGYSRIDELLKLGKRYLEDLLRPVDPGYRCIAFRAANWSMNPSSDIVHALVDNGFLIDTSVFKDGRRRGMVEFDYRHAHSALIPWPIDPSDVCRADRAGRLVEVPIYAESRGVLHFLSVNRVYRALEGRRHRLPVEGLLPAGNGAHGVGRTGIRQRLKRTAMMLASRHAWKLDFNQCSGRQLISAIERLARHYDSADETIPVVLIGHSKTFTRLNERTLDPFLSHLAGQPTRYAFSTFRELGQRDFVTNPPRTAGTGAEVPIGPGVGDDRGS